MDNKKKTLELVHSAAKPKRGNDNNSGGGSGSGEPEALQTFGNYCIKNGAIHQFITSRRVPDAEPQAVPLCDFVVWASKEVLISDGETEESFLTLEGYRNDGRTLPPREIATETFYSGNANYNKLWGALVMVHPGQAKKDNLRAAIHLYSKLKAEGELAQEKHFAHTGWETSQGHYRFLTSSGALGADGLDDTAKVRLEDKAALYYLPPPPSGDSRRVALVRILNRCLDLVTISSNKPQLGAIALCAVFRAPLIELHKVDFALILLGRWGSGKTELAAAMLAYFGTFDARSIPFSWESTENALEKSLYSASSVLGVIDDFVPSVSQMDANKLHSKAQRVLRGVGNQSGRGRMDQNSKQKRAYYPRGLVVSTNEALPRGASLVGRTVVVEMNRGDLNLDMLNSLQESAREGYPALLMAAYIQWLAPQMPALKKLFPAKIRELRDEAIKENSFLSHPRAAEVYANLMAGLDMFLSFCAEEQLMTERHISDMQYQFEGYIKAILKAQSDYQTTQDEPTRFIDLLRAVLSSGNAHIADSFKQNAPKQKPYLYGWRSESATSTVHHDDDDKDGNPAYEPMTTVTYKSCGDLIGWVNQTSDEVYVDMESSFAAVQRFAKHQGDPLLTPKADILRQLGECNIAKASEKNSKSGTFRYDVKRHAGGASRRVVVISGALIRGEV